MFIRVTRNKHCPICDKPDWCSISDKGVVCMRVESKHPTKNGGWFHPNDAASRHEYIKPEPKPRYVPDFGSMLAHWNRGTTNQLDTLAEQLQLEVSAIRELGTVYADVHQAYAFPMCFPDGRYVGIRLRNFGGEKWAVKGSKAGLFIPWSLLDRLDSREVFICEGPTDTIAAIQLGYFAIGRHACRGQEDLVVQIIRDGGVRHAYVLYDNDDPGERGADTLCKMIPCAVTKVVPPAKDLRQFVAEGGSKELLIYLISEAVRKRKYTFVEA